MKRKPELTDILYIAIEDIIYSGKVNGNSKTQLTKPSTMVSERLLASPARFERLSATWRGMNSLVLWDF